MEVELAAVEEDVERKRVGKNPFDEKFTALTESPFIEPLSSENGGQEMETISRHIIARMEVIGKQIAFLSKETAGRPDKILAGVSGDRSHRGQGTANAGDPSADGSTSEGDTGDRSYPLAACDDGEVRGGSGAGGSSSPSPFGALSARVELYRRLRQGLVAAEDLLPNGLLSWSPTDTAAAASDLDRAALSPKAGRTGTGSDDPGTDTVAITGLGRAARGDVGGQALDAAPPGVLHSFIKKVKAFSVCFDYSGPSGGAPTSEDPAAASQSTGPFSGAAGPAAAAAAAAAFPRGGDDEEGDHGNAACFGNILPMSTPAAGGSTGESSQTGGQADAPLRLSRPAGGGPGSEALRRAKARLQGKRKLAYPSPPSARGDRPATVAPRRDGGDGGTGDGDGDERGGGGGGGGGRRGWGGGAGASETNAAKKSARAKKSLAGAGGTGTASRRRDGTGGGGAGGDGGDRAGWLSLSWSSAQRLRKRMESSATQGKSSTGTAPSSKIGGRRGGGGGRAARGASKSKITLSDPLAPATATASGGSIAGGFAPLTFVRSSAQQLDFPEVEGGGVETYLVSLANPARDLAAMKRAFQEEPGASQTGGPEVPSPSLGESPTPAPTAVDGSPPSDGFDFDLGPDFQQEAAAATAAAEDVAGVPRTGNAEQDGKSPPTNNARNSISGGVDSVDPPRLTSSSAPPRAAKQVGGPGTCMIDLKNIWQRTGAVSQAISSAQAAVKQNSLARELRESFVRLDLRHRRNQNKEQERRHVKPRDAGAGDAADDPGHGQEEGGRQRPIDVETSLSVRLRYPTQESKTTESSPTAEVAAASAGGGASGEPGEGAARMFALVVSLAHVHNISSVPAGGGVGEESPPPLSQLHVGLASGGKEAIVTAKTT